ncbi:MAG: glycosyltransferase [Treponema sp.]|nr:glycosyltransferase [Treponema sp.]
MTDVSILMPAYNHERFISQAIESVLSQQTDFSYELLINDDCSTDRTREIALSYAERFPDKITVMFPQKNEGLMKSYGRLLSHASSPYIAILESDDLWTDTHKLQKQLSFLASHEEYGLCVSDYRTIDEAGAVIRSFQKTDDEGLDGNWYGKLLYGNFVCAATIVFRRRDFESSCVFSDFLANGFMTFDLPLLLGVSSVSKCWYIHETTASYRILASSISHNADYEKNRCFEESVYDIQKYAMEKYGTGSYSAEEIKKARVFSLMNKALVARRREDFVRYAKEYRDESLKGFVINHFPTLFYAQHVARGITS